MGLGDIVAIALGGYAFVAKFVLTRDHMVRWNGYEMLFVCGVAGFLLSGVTFPIAITIDAFGSWSKEIGVWTIAGVFGIPVGFVVASLLNYLPWLDRWRLRRLRALAEANLDLIEVLLDDAMQGDWYVELALETGKSYVGLPVRTAYAAASKVSDVELIPVFSGYRTSETRDLRLTRYYGDDIRRFVHDPAGPRKGLSVSDFRVVIPLRQVVGARLFDPEVYQQMNPPEKVRATPL